MKTAISVPDELFKEVEDFAAKHKYSRSEVFVIAVKDFLKRLESRKLLDALNAAYSEEETPEEKALREAGKKRYVKTVLKEKY
ncbi:MAG: ribbon-helix-helix domain-containing protein [Nitrospirae bacterium]|nr:ribbon-helix-helix domain-containing protein [Nitrospirota bacterium]MCL5978661.1 ribbon-helix-helix domain-containing protein [Nitrospirota bacterium]